MTSSDQTRDCLEIERWNDPGLNIVQDIGTEIRLIEKFDINVPID